jgi:hypothetical protein
MPAAMKASNFKLVSVVLADFKGVKMNVFVVLHIDL